MTTRQKHKAWLWHNLCLFQHQRQPCGLTFSLDSTMPETALFRTPAGLNVSNSETSKKQNSQKFISNQNATQAAQVDKFKD